MIKIGNAKYVNQANEVPDDFSGKIHLPDGTKHWYQNGKRHREDGPAAIWPDGEKVWYKNGRLVRKEYP